MRGSDQGVVETVDGHAADRYQGERKKDVSM